MNNRRQQLRMAERYWYFRNSVRRFGLGLTWAVYIRSREHRRHYFISKSTVRGRAIQRRITRK